VNAEVVPRKLFADMYRFGVGNLLLKFLEAFLVTVYVLCHKCMRKARDVLEVGVVLGHTYDSILLT
jgi:hypothetical protein